mmetsp:Transcript_37282/g.86026  ORF Transcript_37282/g.86026 Transcript_37282/m.86026 type:complete len:302 (+) Transcript_37282:912-1817(+)
MPTNTMVYGLPLLRFEIISWRISVLFLGVSTRITALLSAWVTIVLTRVKEASFCPTRVALTVSVMLSAISDATFFEISCWRIASNTGASSSAVKTLLPVAESSESFRNEPTADLPNHPLASPPSPPSSSSSSSSSSSRSGSSSSHSATSPASGKNLAWYSASWASSSLPSKSLAERLSASFCFFVSFFAVPSCHCVIFFTFLPFLPPSSPSPPVPSFELVFFGRRFPPPPLAARSASAARALIMFLNSACSPPAAASSSSPSPSPTSSSSGVGWPFLRLGEGGVTRLLLLATSFFTSNALR